MLNKLARVAAFLLLASAFAARAAYATECDNYQSAHPEWLWCDSFESDSAIDANYFDVNRASGRMALSNEAPFDGSYSLKSSYVAGQQDAGSIKLSLGATPVSPKRYTDRKFDDLYWRFYMKVSNNWVGQAFKVTRGTVFTASDWRQAAIGHLWEDSPTGLGMGLDPVSGVKGSTVVTTKYNDFNNMTWLGKRDGAFQMYGTANRNKWTCVEMHMKLNTPGKSDGVLAFSVNGAQQASATSLDFRGSYTTYGINAILLESFIGGNGAPQNQARYFDNFVVSTQPIGCSGAAPVVRPNPPTNVKVQ
jgi:hypothetical protein